MAEDYYKTLGVRRDASQSDIQKAYRDLARKYHPDMNPNDETAKRKFQEVQQAFDVLNDPEKREMYDRYGSSFETMGAGGPREGAGPAWQGAPGGFQFEDFDFGQFFGERFGEQQTTGGGFADLFGQFRRPGGRTARGAPRRGADLAYELQVPFQTAVKGGEAQITVQRATGKTETISVKIPPGIEDGKKIRIRGQGEPGPRGGSAGDILITVRVAPHPFFQRRGNHLHVKVPVTLAEAALGATIDVPSPKGTVSLHLPQGTSSGTKLRARGQGVAPKGATAGDLIAEVQVVMPKDLTDADRQMLQEIGQRHPQTPREKLRW